MIVVRGEEGVDIAKPVDKEEADMSLDAQAFQASIRDDEIEQENIRNTMKIFP